MEEGSLLSAATAAAVLLTGLLVEGRALTRWRRDAYFLLGFPLSGQLVPLPRSPRAREGRTPSVLWDRATPHVVRWWGQPGAGRIPAGLHGSVVLAQGRRGVELQFRWCPPWTALLAPAWVAALGSARGEASLSVPLAALLLVGVIVAYGVPAARVAAELRWSLASDGGIG